MREADFGADFVAKMHRAGYYYDECTGWERLTKTESQECQEINKIMTVTEDSPTAIKLRTKRGSSQT